MQFENRLVLLVLTVTKKKLSGPTCRISLISYRQYFVRSCTTSNPDFNPINDKSINHIEGLVGVQ